MKTVKIIDGSWMKTFNKEGKLTTEGATKATKAIGQCRDEFRILANSNIKNSNKDYPLLTLMIQHKNSGEIWYCNPFNIKEVNSNKEKLDELKKTSRTY